MSTFIKFLPEPNGDDCAICGGNRHTCDCDDTPAVDSPYAPPHPQPLPLTAQPLVLMIDRNGNEHPDIRRDGPLYRIGLRRGWTEVQS